jgi:multiple sugar transport system substrate-binding protein
MRRLRGRRRLAVAVGVAGALATAMAGTSALGGSAQASGPTGTISLVYSETYELDTKQLADQWYGSIKQQFEKQYPGAHLNLIPVQGTDFDEQKKIDLLLRSPSTSPDVISYETTSVGPLVQSGYLLPLTTYVNSPNTFWSHFAQPIKTMSTINGQVYAVNSGNNVSMIIYNKSMLAKAHVPLPWQPKTWADIIAVAKKVKAANPGVVPFWLHGGVTVGPYVTVVQSMGNLIVGSTNPEMLDPKTNKWVIDSPGLRAALGFYETIFGDGLGESAGQAFNPQAAIQVPTLMKTGKVAIALASNWYPGTWTFSFGVPWPQAPKVTAVAPVPTENGQKPGSATTLAGWCYSVSKASKNPALAWDLIKIMESSSNSISLANEAGFVPPSSSDAASAKFANFAPPQGEFRNYASFATPIPSNGGYAVYGQALDTVTGQIIQNPSTPISSLISTIASTTRLQLAGQTEVQK